MLTAIQARRILETEAVDKVKTLIEASITAASLNGQRDITKTVPQYMQFRVRDWLEDAGYKVSTISKLEILIEW